MDNRQNQNRNSPEISWFLIIIAFAVFWPVGLGLLIYKLGMEGQSQENQQKWSNALNHFKDDVNTVKDNFKEDFQREFQRSREAGQQYNYRPAYEGQASDSKQAAAETSKTKKKASKNASSKKRLPKIKDGRLFTLLGAIFTVAFGIGTIYEAVSSLSSSPLVALQNAIIPFLFAGIGAGMFVWGRFKHGQARRFRKLLNLIGENQNVDIRALAEAMPCSYDRACDMLQNMIDQGYLGEKAYIDMSTGYLVLNGRGVENRKPPEPQTPEEERSSDEYVLEEIRKANDAIPDPELSRKIERIEEITGHILDYQKKHPEKAGELHKFLNYYLPTTLKILNTYAELDQQGIGGENITATKDRIEGMMDLVVEGFEKQLDKLFEGDMMDISSDISVMEKMLNHDGLAGGMKMPRTSEQPQEPDAPAQSAGGIHLTLDPEGDAAAAAAPAPEESWADGFYRRTKEELEN